MAGRVVDSFTRAIVSSQRYLSNLDNSNMVVTPYSKAAGTYAVVVVFC